MKGETKDGFKFEINENGLDDFRFVTGYRKIVKAESDNPESGVQIVEDYMKLINLFMDDEQVDSLADQIAEKEGGVPFARMTEVISEIIGIAKGKN